MKNAKELKLSDHRRDILWMGAALVVSRIVISIVLPRYDDAFITMRYGRNLAEGIGFVFNPGEHVLGETCPGFGLLQSLFFLLHLPMPGAVVALNILCDLGVLVVGIAILIRSGYVKAILPFGILLSLNPIMARICVGGMEMDLQLLLTLAAIVAFHSNRKYLAVSIASFSYFFRPESVLLVGLFCLLEIGNHAWKRAFLMGLVALLIVVGPLVWIYGYYGSIIAQSVTAKSQWTHSSYFTLFRELVFNDPLQVILFVLMLFGFWRVVKRSGPLSTIGMLAFLQILAYAVYHAFIFSWYGETIHLAATILGAVGLIDICERYAIPVLRAFGSRRMPIIGAVSVSVISLGILIVVGPSKVSTKVYGPMEVWFAAHPSGGKTLLAGDIGAIGFYSRSYIYDTDGLVWPEMPKFGSQLDIIHRFKPDLLFLNASGNLNTILSDSAIKMEYLEVQQFSAKPIDLKNLPKDWVQGYILLERRDH